jgi:two-component sensor histidine kinase
MVRPDGTVVDVRATAELFRDSSNHPVRMLGTVLDITERKQAEALLREGLEVKEMLLREVHHRVKNNLQVVSSLLAMQSDGLVDPVPLAALQASITRLHAMALIHERLCQSETLSYIDFGEYACDLTGFLFRSYRVSSPLNLVMDVEPCLLSIKTAVPCGLILNELVSNALKHSFRQGQPGNLFVGVRAEPEGGFRMTVRDTGSGLPPGFDIGDMTSLGLQLVVSLTKQIRGTLAIQSEGGVGVSITFKEPADAAQ